MMSPDNRIQFVDKKGVTFEAEECGQEHYDALKQMYDEFYPKGESQGLPPPGEHDRHRWIERLLRLARNFVIWSGDKVVGHSALIPDPEERDGEYIIFVSRPCRQRGLGTALTRMAVERARSMGLVRIWLTVESYNFRAIKLYRKTGFVFTDQGERERTMVLIL